MLPLFGKMTAHKNRYSTLLKWLCFALWGAVVVLLAAATIIEKSRGTAFAIDHIYTARWMVALWCVATLAAVAYLLQTKLYRRVVVFALHASLLLILIGAFITHIASRHGVVHLSVGNTTNEYILDDGTEEQLPFRLTLRSFDILYHRGSQAPMDYISVFEIDHDGTIVEGEVSMNNIFRYEGYRLSQASFDEDGRGVCLSVAYDRWGIGVTYAGYAALLLSIIAFMCSRATAFRALLSHPALRRGAMIVALVAGTHSAMAADLPRTIPRDAATEFGRLAVYHNERICPMQTFAIEFTTKLYGKAEYRGLSAEQVVAGWYFFYDDWKEEPMIKVKGSVASTVGVEGKYAALTDFMSVEGNKLAESLRSDNRKLRGDAEAANEKLDLIYRLAMGELFKIFPVADDTGVIEWYSQGEQLPASLKYEEWLFINNSLNLIAEHVAMRDYTRVEELFGKIAKYQRQQASSVMPTEQRFDTELLYNATNHNRLIAIVSMTLGFLGFVVFNIVAERRRRWVVRLLGLWLAIIVGYLSFRIALRWYVCGYVPLSNGYETMLFMSWSAAVITLFMSRKMRLAIPFGALISGATLMVAMMGEASPRITQLMPVLHSPLLSIHVVVIMLAYTLLAFILLNGVAAIIAHLRHADEDVEYHTIVGRIMLYPALFLLVIGIFIGAVWANVSWGRYWGWDPKEVWALITMLIYALPVHSSSIRAFQRPLVFNIFVVCAFLSVLITYFGVNYFLGGMHSYA